MSERRVQLRDESDGHDRRTLAASIGENRSLVLHGHDLGPATSILTDRGDYEWYRTVAVTDVPRLLELVGADPGADVLDVLEARFKGEMSYELEAILRDGDIPSSLWNWY